MSESYAVGGGLSPTPHPCTTKPLPRNLTSDQWTTITQRAGNHPLSHPLFFSLSRVGYKYAPPRHLVELYQSVYAAISDQRLAPKNLARFYPREHGKSEAASHVIPSWLALYDPNIRVLLLSETEKQAKAKLRECRETIEAHGPDFGVAIEESNKTELTVERTETFDVPTIQAAGFNTGITGGHYDCLIYDDILSYGNQRTETRRQKIQNQFEDYLNLGSEGESTFLVIGTRKHPDDLYGDLIESPAWDTLVGKAIGDWSIAERKDFDVITNTGNRYDGGQVPTIPPDETITSVEPHREVPVLWPERWPLSSLLMDLLQAQAEGESSRVWLRENQNRADAFSGEILSVDLLEFIQSLPDIRRYEDWSYQAALDVAIESDAEKAARNDSDYWGLCVYTNHPRHDITYIVDLQRQRGMTLQQAIRWVKSSLSQWNTNTVTVEDNQAQAFFVQEAKRKGLNCVGTTSTGKKEDRIISMSSGFESGRIKLVESTIGDDMIETLVDEWTQFPTASHDDVLDSIEIAMRQYADNPAKNTVRSPFA